MCRATGIQFLTRERMFLPYRQSQPSKNPPVFLARQEPEVGHLPLHSVGYSSARNYGCKDTTLQIIITPCFIKYKVNFKHSIKSSRVHSRTKEWKFSKVSGSDFVPILTHWGGVTQICVSNKRLFSLHNTLNYAIHRACLRMVLLTDVYRNLTSLWINL